MSNFQVYLDTFKITNTRSIHDDTLAAGFCIYVNGKPYGPTSAGLGNFNNGTHSFSKHGLKPITDVPIAAKDSLILSYQIFNNGDHGYPNPNLISGLVEQAVEATLSAKIVNHSPGSGAGDDHENIPVEKPDQLQGEQEDGDSGGTSAPVLENVLTGGLYSLIKYGFKDCDGPVAGGVFQFTGAQIIAAINATADKVFQQSNTFNGKKEGYGAPCNHSGSDYIVNWAIKPS